MLLALVDKPLEYFGDSLVLFTEEIGTVLGVTMLLWEALWEAVLDSDKDVVKFTNVLEELKLATGDAVG